MAIRIEYIADTRAAFSGIQTLNREVQRTNTLLINQLRQQAAIERRSQQANSVMAQAIRSTNQAVTQLNSSLVQTQRQVRVTTTQFSSLRTTALRVGGVVSAALGGVGAASLVGTTSDVTRLRNQLAAVLPTGQSVNQVFSELDDISRRTRTPIQDIGNLFATLVARSDPLITSQAEIRQEVEGLAAALRVSGASAAAANSAIVQYGQAIASTDVQLEELRPILEASPLFQTALADVLNINRSALIEFQKDVGVTSEEIREAARNLTNYSNILQQLDFPADEATRLLGREIGLLADQFLRATGIANSVGLAIVELADSFRAFREDTDAFAQVVPRVIQVLTILGTVLAGLAARAIVNFVIGIGISTFELATNFVAAVRTATRWLITNFVPALRRAAAASRALFVAILGISTPVLITVAAISALVAAFVFFGAEIIGGIVTLVTEWNRFNTLLVSGFRIAMQELKILWLELINFLSIESNGFIDRFINGFVNGFRTILRVINPALAAALDLLVFDDLNGSVTGSVDHAKRELERLRSIYADASAGISNAFQSNTENAEQSINTLIEGISATIAAFAQSAGALWNEILEANPSLKTFVDAVTGNADVSDFGVPDQEGLAPPSPSPSPDGDGDDANARRRTSEELGNIAESSVNVVTGFGRLAETLGLGDTRFAQVISRFSEINSALQGFLEGIGNLIGSFGGAGAGAGGGGGFAGLFAQQGGIVPAFQRGTISVPGFQRGTRRVPGIGFGDTRLIAAEPGEMIIPNRQRDRDALGLGGGDINANFTINGDITRQTRREIEQMSLDGTIPRLLNSANLQAGGQPVFRNPV